MTLEEEKVLVAEFMGCMAEVAYENKTSGVKIYTLVGLIVEDWRKSGLHTGGSQNRMSASMCKFHDRWDWLMMVVEKIESIYDPHHGYFGVFISSNGCTIQGTHLNRAIDDLDGYGHVYFSHVVCDTKLQSTYAAVLQFIQWYNENYKS